MQTFLPYRSFVSSARVLDNKRLGKQRVETLQIMKALVTGVGWIHHPVTKMWEGYEWALLSYQTVTCNEWTSRTSERTGRHFQDTCLDKTRALYDMIDPTPMPQLPPWLGLKRFHSPHRGNLLRKDPIHYGQFGWKELPIEGYFYPSPKEA